MVYYSDLGGYYMVTKYFRAGRNYSCTECVREAVTMTVTLGLHLCQFSEGKVFINPPYTTTGTKRMIDVFVFYSYTYS